VAYFVALVTEVLHAKREASSTETDWKVKAKFKDVCVVI